MKAYVYIAGSRRHSLIKVGWSESPVHRERLLSNIGHGGVHDWQLLYCANYQDAQKVEFAAHARLSCFVSPQTWVRENRIQETREIFACSYSEAIAALKDASSVEGEDAWEASPSTLQNYEFRKLCTAA
jgi:hypothetical protein